MQQPLLLPVCACLIALAAAEPARAEPLASGLYVGLHGGFGTGTIDGRFDTFESDREDRVEGEFELERGAAGVMLGYNHAVGRWVIGLEGDVSWMDWSDTVSDADIEGTLAETDRVTANLDWLASVRARAGLTVGSALIYATAGIAFAGAEWTPCDCDNGVADVGKLDLRSTGFIAGGGLETDLGAQWRLRAEGLYATFGEDHSGAALTPDSDFGDFAALEDIWIARAAVVYRLAR